MLAAFAGRRAAAHAGARAWRLLRKVMRRLAAQTSIDRAAKSSNAYRTPSSLVTSRRLVDQRQQTSQLRAIACSGAVARGRAPFGLSEALGCRWRSSHLCRAIPTPDVLGTQGALSLQVCGIDGIAQPAVLRARGRGSRSVQKRFLCGEETRHPGKYLRRMRGTGLRQQSAALQASTTFATAAVAAAVAVQCVCTTRGAAACYARRRRTICHAARRIAARAVPHCAAPGGARRRRSLAAG